MNSPQLSKGFFGKGGFMITVISAYMWSLRNKNQRHFQPKYSNFIDETAFKYAVFPMTAIRFRGPFTNRLTIEV